MRVITEKPLTADEYYQNALKAMAMEPGVAQSDAISEVSLNVRAHEIRLSQEQAMDLKRRALSLFRAGNAEPLLGFAWVFAVAGVQKPESGFWAPVTPEVDKHQIAGCRVSIMREAGILEPDERVLSSDMGFMEIGNRGVPRVGLLLVTDRRVLMEGSLVPPHEYMPDAYRLFYDDYETKPWLYFVDYLWLNRITSIESKWGLLTKTVVADYQTKYLREKFHTLFGPYFFKWRLPSTVSVSEGLLKVCLTPGPLASSSMDSRSRQEELVKRILEAKAKLVSGKRQSSP